MLQAGDSFAVAISGWSDSCWKEYEEAYLKQTTCYRFQLLLLFPFFLIGLSSTHMEIMLLSYLFFFSFPLDLLFVIDSIGNLEYRFFLWRKHDESTLVNLFCFIGFYSFSCFFFSILSFKYLWFWKDNELSWNWEKMIIFKTIKSNFPTMHGDTLTIPSYKLWIFGKNKVFDGSTTLDTCRTLIGPSSTYFLSTIKAHLFPFFPLISSHCLHFASQDFELDKSLIPKTPLSLGKLLQIWPLFAHTPTNRTISLARYWSYRFVLCTWKLRFLCLFSCLCS